MECLPRELTGQGYQFSGMAWTWLAGLFHAPNGSTYHRSDDLIEWRIESVVHRTEGICRKHASSVQRLNVENLITLVARFRV